MPIRLYLAPRPGLEPGTYGLTVRKMVLFLAFRDSLPVCKCLIYMET